MPRQLRFDQLIQGTVTPIVREAEDKFNQLRFEPEEAAPDRFSCKIVKGDEDAEPAIWEIRGVADKVVILARIEPGIHLPTYQRRRDEVEAIKHTIEYSLINLANLKMRPRNLQEHLIDRQREHGRP